MSDSSLSPVHTADDLTDRLIEHCEQLSVTGQEAELADTLAARYADRGEQVVRVGDSLVVGGPAEDRPLVALVGHLDVVPPTDDDLTPRRATRHGEAVVVGRGTSDMKAGNVVAMACFEDGELRARSPYAVVMVLYAREEGPAEENELGDVLDEVTWLRDATLAVVLEPTDGEVQVGCLGGLHALVHFRGAQAHSARPWHGRNALTAAGPLLGWLEQHEPRAVTVDGVTFHDVWSATQAWTTNARNVIPGHFVVNLNYRFAPDRTLAQAEAELRDLVARHANQIEVEIIDRSPPAPPRLEQPVVRAFMAAVEAPVAGKQAWTDVARFAEMGVPALNFGPGLTAQAHQRGEYVPVDAMELSHRRLRDFLAGEG